MEEDYISPKKHPKLKKCFYEGTFEKRQQARSFCKNNRWEEGLTIIHPNGEEEKFFYESYIDKLLNK